MVRAASAGKARRAGVHVVRRAGCGGFREAEGRSVTRPTTATLEAVCLCGLATIVYVRQETITSMWMRARRHPLGLLTGGALTGIGVAHIWMEDPVLRQLVKGDMDESVG